MTLERNQVYCMDALDLLRQMDEGSVDLIVTSPPYDNLRQYKGYSWDFEGIARESYRVLKIGGVIVWVVGDATIDGSETLTSFRQALYFKDVVGFRMHDTMIFEKNVPGVYGKRYEQAFEFMFVLSKGEPLIFSPLMTNSSTPGKVRRALKRGAQGTHQQNTARVSVQREFKRLSNIWYMPTGNNLTTRDDVDHPAMFPEALAERHILTWSNPGDLVVDFFGGSGTTAKMARANNRDYITGDISEEYCDLMRRRLALPYTLPMFEAVRP